MKYMIMSTIAVTNAVALKVNEADAENHEYGFSPSSIPKPCNTDADCGGYRKCKTGSFNGQSFGLCHGKCEIM